MKELTIEQKAAAYDEAVINGSRLWECGEITRESYEYIFPELKESEGEKMRKGIIRNLEYLMDRAEGFVKDELKERIAWLEKQKVLTTKEDLQGKEDVLWCIKQAQKYAKDENEMGTCWFAEKWLKRQGEKGAKGNEREIPFSEQEWSEEDSRILYNVKAYIGYAAGQRGVKDELFKEANEWLNSLPIGFIYNKNYNEDMVTLLVSELKQIANDNNVPEQYQMEINWLKSLRPQKQWKPSDEQMKALDIAIRCGIQLGTWEEDALKSLKE